MVGVIKSNTRGSTAWDASFIIGLYTPVWLCDDQGNVVDFNDHCSKLPPWLQDKLKQEGSIWDPAQVTPQSEELIASYHEQLKTGAPGRVDFKHDGVPWTLIHFKASEPSSAAYVNIAFRDCRIRPERQVPDSCLTELKNFAIEFHYIREEERAEVARNIHDHLGQEITVLRLALHRLQQDILNNGTHVPQNWKTQLESLAHQVDEVMKSAKGIAYELRPDVIRSRGLAAAASALVIDFCKRSGIRGNIEVSVGWADPLPDMSLHLYRSLQEMLNNLAKHSKATSFFVRLRLSQATQEYSLEVVDNGVGFPAWIKEQLYTGEVAGNGMGVRGFMERAAIYGGRVDVRTRPDIKGSLIRMVLPQQRKQAPA